MGDVRKIYCPKCGRKAMQHDGKSEITKSVKCQKCKKLVVFNPITNETVIAQRRELIVDYELPIGEDYREFVLKFLDEK